MRELQARRWGHAFDARSRVRGFGLPRIFILAPAAVTKGFSQLKRWTVL